MPIANKTMHTNDMRYLADIEKMSFWSKTEIKEWQNRKFEILISHFYSNTEYFPDLLATYGYHISDFQSLDDISRIPITNKEIFNKHRSKIIPRNISQIKHIAASTGGSSGDPLKFLLDYNSWSFTIANKIYNWQKAGYKFGDSHIALGSSSLFPNSKSWKHKAFYLLKREIPLNGIKMSDPIIHDYVALIKRKKVRFLYGYASSLFLLARYTLRKGIKIHHVEAVFPTSEILTANFRDTIQEAFNCIILDSYGARDGGITAFEINKERYHVGYNSYINVTSAKQNTPNPIIITDLLNFAFPFINYQLGDLIDLVEGEKYDQYNGQVIRKIYGRESDIMYLANGNVITGPGFTILFKDFNISAYQIKKLDDSHIECSLQKMSNFTISEEKKIIETIQQYIGLECNLDIKYTDHIQVGENGKVKYFITE